MKLKLITLPDAKKFHKNLTIGKEYLIVKSIGNCHVIVTDDSSDQIVVLQSRFE